MVRKLFGFHATLVEPAAFGFPRAPPEAMTSSSEPMHPEQLLIHAQWVRGLAMRLVEDSNLADDVVQDTWVAALRRPPRGGLEPSSVRAWLARVVRNSALQRFRGDSRRSAREFLECSESAAGSREPEDDLIEQLESQRRLVQEVLALGEGMRSAIILRYFKNLSAVEIAKQQGLPAATVRSRLARALSELRERMDEQYDGDRSAWCLALAGLWQSAPPVVPLGGNELAMSPSSLAGGTILMKVSLILFGVVGLAALTVVGLKYFGEQEFSQVVATESIPDQGPSAPQSVVQTPSLDVLPTNSPLPSRIALESAPKPKPKLAVATEPVVEENPTCTLIARFIDEFGGPVQGVKWISRDQGSQALPIRGQATSGVDGVARLVYKMTRLNEEPLLCFSKPGFAAGVTTSVAKRGAEVHLGDIALKTSVLLAGRVVDSEGAPIPGAQVYLLEPKLPHESEWQAKRAGPNDFGGVTPEQRVLAVSTSLEGRFELEAASDRALRVWAGAEGWRFAWTEVLELEVGHPIYDLELVLEPRSPEDRIAGIALSAEGIPLANRSVQYEFGSQDLGLSSSLSTDESGAFELILLRPVPHTFSLKGDEEFPGQASARSVAPGTLDLELKLSLEGEIELVVQNNRDLPITKFELRTIRIHGQSSMGASRVIDNAEGKVDLLIPSDQFEFEVSADGYQEKTLGPYDADTCPGRILCVLEPVVGVSGLVMDASEPVAGVEVALFRLARPDSMNTANGFPTRFQGRAVDTATTDDQGAFELLASVDGQYLVRVAASEDGQFAAAESATFDLQVQVGYSDLVLSRGRSASLLVLVRTLPGQDAAGIIVGITDGGGDSRTQRTNSKGEARFDALRPGSWIVQEQDRELQADLPSYGSVGGVEGYQLPWNLELRPGESAVFELFLEPEDDQDH